MRMNLLSKAVFLAASVGLALSLTACSGDKEKVTVINFSHTQSPNSLTDLTANKFKEIVEKASNGKIEVHIFTNCGLSGGDLTKALELVQTGNIDIHSCAPANIAGYHFYSQTKKVYLNSAQVKKSSKRLTHGVMT